MNSMNEWVSVDDVGKGDVAKSWSDANKQRENGFKNRLFWMVLFFFTSALRPFLPVLYGFFLLAVEYFRELFCNLNKFSHSYSLENVGCFILN